jgi:hypothetical protein
VTAKKFFRKLKKMLDRQTDRWYNKSTERGKQKTQAEKNFKKIKKKA